MTEQGDEQRPLQAEFALEAALREVEAHVASGGWDQPARLYALVPTADLLMREPGLAEALGIEGDPPPGHLTPVEQELPADGEPLETVLQSVEWPAAVRGCGCWPSARRSSGPTRCAASWTPRMTLTRSVSTRT